MNSAVSPAAAKYAIWEKGPGFRSGIEDLGKHINFKTFTAGFIAAVFGCTGPTLITINAAAAAGYTQADTVTWLFGIYVFGAAIGIIMGLYYKIPIVGAYSIPGASMLGVALAGFSYNEAGAAFMMAGIIVLFLGITGLISKAMKWLPLPIVMGMVGGCMFRFGTDIVTSAAALPFVCGAALAGFFILPLIIKKFPAVLGALVLGLLSLIVTGELRMEETSFVYIAPRIIAPHFNVATILSVSVPLAVLVVGTGNAQAVGALYAQGYKPPINAMTVISGVAGIATGLVGAHNASIAGPMTAICSSEEAGDNKEGRYAASIINGIFFGLFGIFASFTIAFVSVIPSQLINMLAGLAMINVLINAFRDGFGSGKYRMGAFAALVISASGITILSIGSAFWALIGGVVISMICEKKDFDILKKKTERH
jgi:benzoate membrane transport protein